MSHKTLDPQKAAAMREQIEFLKELVDRLGPEVLDVADQRSRRNTVAGWKTIGEHAPSVTMESFVDILWHQFCIPDGLEFTMEKTGDAIQMHCTYCPWVEVAKAAGSTKIGYHMLCMSDPYMIEGFNQAAGPDDRKIKFSRRKTLMQGDDFCDHRYEYE